MSEIDRPVPERERRSQVWLVTGAAGFIGFHVTKRLLDDGHEVVGLDNLNNYYDVQLKRDRLTLLSKRAAFHFRKIDLQDRVAMEALFAECRFDRVVHLGAQAGVRYSLENPHTYLESNIIGFQNVLEGCRQQGVEHLVYASSSSVYGANTKQPFAVADKVDQPLSLYAATKKSNELVAHTYASLYELPVTGLRFFTVYGPWGRPDMALFLFTRAILAGVPIDVFNYGNMERDFTYIDDIVEGVVRVADHIPGRDSGSDDNGDRASRGIPYRVFNIGRGRPIPLMKFIESIEQALGRQAKKNFLPMQPGDVHSTHADVSRLSAVVGYRPTTTVEEGVRRFVDWYREYCPPVESQATATSP